MKEIEGFKRLETNKSQTQIAVEQYLRDVPADKPSFAKLAEVELKAARESARQLSGESRNSAYNNIIECLEARRDAQHGIVRSYSEPHADGTKDLIRDATHAISSEYRSRDVGTSPKKLVEIGAVQTSTEVGEEASLAVQYVNLVKAAEVLLDLAVERNEITEERVRECRETLREEVKTLVDQLHIWYTPDALKQDNYKLLESLRGIKNADGKPLFSDKKALEKDLFYAKELVQLDSDHYHVSTISKVEDEKGADISKVEDEKGADRFVVESDVMQLGLTPKLKSQFEHIRDGKKGVDWFDQLDPVKQGLIKRYAQAFIDGKHVIPTQLVDLVPGMRNAYEKVTSVSEGKGPELKLEVVHESKHSGTPTFHGKGDHRLQATMDTVEQAQSFTKDGRLRLSSLNSSGDGFSHDPTIVGLSEAVAKKMAAEGVSLVVTPINSRRGISKDTSKSDYNKVLSEVARVAIDAELIAVHQFLLKGDGLFNDREKKALEELKKSGIKKSNPKLFADLETAIEAKSYILKKPSIFQRASILFKSIWKGRSKENAELELAARMSLIEHSIGKGALSKYAEKRGMKLAAPESLVYCKSGKDRTGLLEFRSSNLAVAKHLGVDPDGDKGKAIAKSMAEAAHTSTMSAFQGGSRGCYGILTSNDRHIPEAYPDLLTSRAANSVEIKTERPTRLTDIRAERAISQGMMSGRRAGTRAANAASEGAMRKIGGVRNPATNMEVRLGTVIEEHDVKSAHPVSPRVTPKNQDHPTRSM